MFIAIGDDPAWAALTAFRALIAPAGRISALQALDGLAAGASQRELAVALFGSSAVARGWQPDGVLSVLRCGTSSAGHRRSWPGNTAR